LPVIPHPQGSHAGSLEVFAGEHAKHARHGKRCGRIDRLDPRMRVRRAHEDPDHHVRSLDVGDIIAAAGQETLILLAKRPGADADDV
jgi:hypothetical protein